MSDRFFRAALAFAVAALPLAPSTTAAAGKSGVLTPRAAVAAERGEALPALAEDPGPRRAPEAGSLRSKGRTGTPLGTFSDTTSASGLRGPHSALTDSDFPEVPAYLVTGQAWADYDRDGWVDLYLTDQRGPNTLYRNHGDGSFGKSPLSRSVSLPKRTSGGAVFADYDNDGWPDLYVTTAGQDALFHNDQGRGFTDASRHAGIRDHSTGTTASWGDYDGDGYLDLYVANYGCNLCNAHLDDGEQDRLYHNDGDGTFSDATALLDSPKTHGFGFVGGWADYDNDHDLDLYLVNDVRGVRYLYPNALFRNDGPGCGGWCFRDVSEESGAGVRADAMGLAVGDYDNDRDLDFFVSNSGWDLTSLTGPSFLLQNVGEGSFRNVAREAAADVDETGWGTVFLDYDNDGWQDLYLGLGDMDLADRGDWGTTNRLLRNRGNGSFEDVTEKSGAASSGDTYGVAAADYNNDGWTDLVIGNMNTGYRLYGNSGSAGRGNNRLLITLQGRGPVNRDAIGARAYLTTDDGHTQLREVMAGSSLGAGSDRRLQFGLGKAGVRRLRIVWPDGLEQAFTQVRPNVEWRLSYGGRPSQVALPPPRVAAAPVGAIPQPGRLGPGGLFVPALATLATLGLIAYALGRRSRRPKLTARVLLLLLAGAVSFQVGHLLEHFLQIGFWVHHPNSELWITPWGKDATDGFTALAGDHGGRATGTELLHLAGNWVFLSGLLAAFWATRGWRGPLPGRGALMAAFGFELVHVLEHISLTSTWFAFGTPIGISTGFGQTFDLEGAWAPSIRAWWHFFMNFIPTVAAVIAYFKLLGSGMLRPAWGKPTPEARRRTATASS